MKHFSYCLLGMFLCFGSCTAGADDSILALRALIYSEDPRDVWEGYKMLETRVGQSVADKNNDWELHGFLYELLDDPRGPLQMSYDEGMAAPRRKASIQLMKLSGYEAHLKSILPPERLFSADTGLEVDLAFAATIDEIERAKFLEWYETNDRWTIIESRRGPSNPHFVVVGADEKHVEENGPLERATNSSREGALADSNTKENRDIRNLFYVVSGVALLIAIATFVTVIKKRMRGA
ncbi:MAG: hypothetical protein AAF591_08020 [Verrucomicrobiota bacterium]